MYQANFVLTYIEFPVSQLTEKNWSRWKSCSPFVSLDVGAKTARWCQWKKKKNKSEAQQYSDSNTLTETMQNLLNIYCYHVSWGLMGLFFAFSFMYLFLIPSQAEYEVPDRNLAYNICFSGANYVKFSSTAAKDKENCTCNKQKATFGWLMSYISLLKSLEI